jgi:hypothetical protein
MEDLDNNKKVLLSMPSVGELRMLREENRSDLRRWAHKRDNCEV